MAYVGANTNYRITGTDIGTDLVTRDYLIDVYPSLVDNFRFAGLWLWGPNNFGRIGDNTITPKSSPVQTVAGGADWKQVSCGRTHTAAIKTDGRLWLWGENASGQLGTNSTTRQSSPVQTVSGGTNWKQISCGDDFTGAIKTDGTLWMWGDNYPSGQLGLNDRARRSSPTQIGATSVWKYVSCGRQHTLILRNDNYLFSIGNNYSGQLGIGDTIVRSSPVIIGNDQTWIKISAGFSHSAAIKNDGTLWMWGSNSGGELGNGSGGSVRSPIQTVSGGTNWKQVSCGQNYTGAIKTDGTLWMWGINSNGELGTNDRTNRSSPVQTISAGTNWNQVSCGSCAAAIKTDGTLWTWGFNFNGRLGTNDTNSRSSPVQTVSGGTNWKQVSSGYGIASIRDQSSDPFRADPL